MNDVILMQVLEAHEDLAEVGSGDREVHGFGEVVGRSRGRRKVEKDAAWAVLEDLERRSERRIEEVR